MDFVGLPVYSWGCAAGFAVRMAARITGRSHVLVPDTISPERLAVIRTYCGAAELPRRIEIELVAHDAATGGSTSATSRRGCPSEPRPSSSTTRRSSAASSRTPPRSRSSHAAAAPRRSSASTRFRSASSPRRPTTARTSSSAARSRSACTCRAAAARAASSPPDDPRYAHEYPTLLLSITETVAGEHGFGIALFEQTSYGSREEGNDWTGNSVYLWAVANAAYMSLMGPHGLRGGGPADHGAQPLRGSPSRRDRRCAGGLPRGLLQGVRRRLRRQRARRLRRSTAALRERGIFGGQDLSRDFPGLGQAALYCVTEVHTQADLDRLVAAVAEVVA